VVGVIDGLDLSAISKSYGGSGSALQHPVVLLVHGCATVVFFSRKLERATYDSVTFRFIAANDPPPTTMPSQHSGDASSRRIGTLFVQVLLLAREIGVLKMGTVVLDSTKIHANASRHSALLYEQRGQDRGAA
jgi:transposase